MVSFFVSMMSAGASSRAEDEPRWSKNYRVSTWEHRRRFMQRFFCPRCAIIERKLSVELFLEFAWNRAILFYCHRGVQCSKRLLLCRKVTIQLIRVFVRSSSFTYLATITQPFHLLFLLLPFEWNKFTEWHITNCSILRKWIPLPIPIHGGLQHVRSAFRTPGICSIHHLRSILHAIYSRGTFPRMYIRVRMAWEIRFLSPVQCSRRVDGHGDRIDAYRIFVKDRIWCHGRKLDGIPIWNEFAEEFGRRGGILCEFGGYGGDGGLDVRVKHVRQFDGGR